MSSCTNCPDSTSSDRHTARPCGDRRTPRPATPGVRLDLPVGFRAASALADPWGRDNPHMRQDKLSVIGHAGLLHGGNLCPARPQEQHPRQTPLTAPETRVEARVHDRPPRRLIWRGPSQPWCGARRSNRRSHSGGGSSASCGLDPSWREGAGTVTALSEALTDPAVAERWRACGH